MFMSFFESIDFNKLSRQLLHFTIAALGCSVQIYFVCEQYFRYSVTTDLRVSREENMTLPGMAVCFKAKYFQKKDYTGPVGPIEGRSINDLLKEIRDPMNEFFITNMSITQLGNFFSNNITSPANPMKMSKFIRKEDYCFAIETKWDGFHFPQDFILAGFVVPQILAIRFKAFWFESLTTFKFFFYSRLRRYLDVSESSMTLTRTAVGFYNGSIEGHEYPGVVRKPTKSHVSFARFNLTLLEYPYQSNCRHYDKYYPGLPGLQGPFASQGECFYTCYIKRVKNKYSSWPSLLTVDNSSDTLLTFAMAKSNESLQSDLSRMYNWCYEICKRQNCIREDFVPRKVTESNFEDIGHFTLGLLVPVDPDISITAKPMMEMIEFVTYVLSCISFWLGFAPFGFFSENDVLVRAHGYILRRYTKGTNVVPIKTRIIRAPKFEKNIKGPPKITLTAALQQAANESVFVFPNREYGQPQTSDERRAQFGAQYSQAASFAQSFQQENAFSAQFSEEKQFYARFAAFKDFRSDFENFPPTKANAVTSGPSKLDPGYEFNSSSGANLDPRLVQFGSNKYNKSFESFYNFNSLQDDSYSQEERDILTYINRVMIWFKGKEDQIDEMIERYKRSEEQRKIDSKAYRPPKIGLQNLAKKWRKRKETFSPKIIFHR